MQQLWRWLGGSGKRGNTTGVELSSCTRHHHAVSEDRVMGAAAAPPRGDGSGSNSNTPLQRTTTATATALAADIHPVLVPPTHFAHSSPDAARLVLNALLEAGQAAAGAEDATTTNAIAAAVAAGGCWQAACEQCRQQAVLLSALLQHCVPDACLPPDCLEQQQQQQQADPGDQQQQQPFIISNSANSSAHQTQRQLAAVVLLGEAARLCQQPHRLEQLQQLLVSQQAQQQQHPLSSGTRQSATTGAHPPPAPAAPQDGRMQALLWPLLHAWLQELHNHVLMAEQQQSTVQGQLSQHITARDRLAWLQLATALLQLQEQNAATSSTQQQQQQRPLVLLRQLEGLPVPPLIQAADLAAPLQLQQPEPPDNLQLLLLLRLSRCSNAAQHLAAAAVPGPTNSSSTEHQQHVASIAHEVQQLLARALQELLGAVPPTTAAAVRAALTHKIATQQQSPERRQPAAVSKAVPAPRNSDRAPPPAAAQRLGTGGQAAGVSQGSSVCRIDATAAAAAAPVSSDPTSPRTITWPAELLGTAELFPGDAGEDDAAITREERTLRAWINSLLLNAGGSSRASGGGLVGSGGSGSVLPLSPRANGRGSSSSGGSCCAADVPVAGWCPEPVAPGTPRAARSTPAAAGTAAAAAAAAGKVRSTASAAAAPAAAVAASAAHHRSCQHISSLFGPELRSGVLLLELLELLQPGCVRQVNRPPFHPRTAQLQALENCSAALAIAQEELGLPLVSFSAHDIFAGRRKAILSLVYQLMRFHTFKLLESISTAQEEGRGAAAATAAGRPQAQSSGLQQQGRQSSGVGMNSSSSTRKPPRRRPAVRDEDILRWAHNRLQDAPTGPLLGPAGDAGGGSTPAAAFLRDPTGLQLLRLLSVLAPDLVDPAVVRLGATPEERESNAKYALAVAEHMGCSLFLVWEDLVERGMQQRMILMLLATLMHHDLSRRSAGGAGSGGGDGGGGGGGDDGGGQQQLQA